MHISPINNKYNYGIGFTSKVFMSEYAVATISEMSKNAPREFNFKKLSSQLKKIENNGKDDIFYVDSDLSLKNLFMVVEDTAENTSSALGFLMQDVIKGKKLNLASLYKKLAGSQQTGTMLDLSKLSKLKSAHGKLE